MGRVMCTLLTDTTFGPTAYRASQGSELMDAYDVFLSECTVLPPGEWDPNIRIDPPEKLPEKKVSRQDSPDGNGNDDDEGVSEALERKERDCAEAGLVRSCWPFEGLVGDVRRKSRWYLSDLRDGFNLQCLAAVFFMYFAVLAPTIAFGSLLSEITDNHVRMNSRIFFLMQRAPIIPCVVRSV